MATSQVTRFSFPCIIIHQTSLIHALEGNTFLQIQKLWDAICYAFCQSLSTNKSWPPDKKIKVESYEITKFLISTDTHYKYATSKEKFKAFSRAIRVHIVKYTTISSLKEPKPHVKNFTYMHYYNVSEPFY